MKKKAPEKKAKAPERKVSEKKAPDREALKWPPKIGALVLLYEKDVIHIPGRVLPYADRLRPGHPVAVKCTDQIVRNGYPGRLYPY